MRGRGEKGGRFKTEFCFLLLFGKLVLTKGCCFVEGGCKKHFHKKNHKGGCLEQTAFSLPEKGSCSGKGAGLLSDGEGGGARGSKKSEGEAGSCQKKMKKIEKKSFFFFQKFLFCSSCFYTIFEK